MHIVHYTSAHPWTSSRIFSKMCVHLSQLGCQVELVAIDTSADTTQVFEKNGVTVHLLSGRDITSRLRRATIAARRVTRYARFLNPDLLHFHDPELIPFTITDLPRNIPIIFDAHEDFVIQMDLKTWTSGLKRQVLKVSLKFLRNLINRRATHVIAATEGVRSSYNPMHSSVIRNFPILLEMGIPDRMSLPERRKEACYIGSISEARGLREVVQALALTKDVDIFHLAGKFTSDTFKQDLEGLPGWKKVHYHGFINRAQIIRILGRVRLGLVTLHATPNHLHSIPIKLLEYMGAGVPTLASDFSYWREFMVEGINGRFVDPLDVDSLATAMDSMVSDDYCRSLETLMNSDVRRRYAWEKEVLILVDLYRQCLEAKK